MILSLFVVLSGAKAETSSGWEQVKVALKQRDMGKLDKAIKILTDESVRSTEGERIVKLIGAQGEDWVRVPDLEDDLKKLMRHLKLCDTYLSSESYEDLRRMCSDDDDLSLFGKTPSKLHQAFYDVQKSAHLDDEEFLANFQEKLEQAEAKIKAAKEAQANQSAIAEAEQQQKKEQELHKIEQDPKTWAERACGNLKDINFLKAQIDQEKDAAKHSGVVSKGKLYGLGQAIQIKTEILESQKKHYKEKSKGKTWSPSLCK
jgi:hypothetical protein